MKASDKVTVTSGWRGAVALPGQSWRVLSHPQPGQQGDHLRLVDIGALSTIGAVLAYAVFEWGGVLRTDQYHYLLVLGLLAMALSLARPRRQWAPLPDRVVRTTLAILPAYTLMQVVPLPVALLRVLSSLLTLTTYPEYRLFLPRAPRPAAVNRDIGRLPLLHPSI